MPVLDWTRTSLDYEVADGSKALRFDVTAFAAFELFILKRPGATSQYNATDKSAAQAYFNNLTEPEIKKLTNNIIERKLKVQATSRNHRTMLKLLDLSTEV